MCFAPSTRLTADEERPSALHIRALITAHLCATGWCDWKQVLIGVCGLGVVRGAGGATIVLT